MGAKVANAPRFAGNQRCRLMGPDPRSGEKNDAIAAESNLVTLRNSSAEACTDTPDVWYRCTHRRGGFGRGLQEHSYSRRRAGQATAPLF